MNKKTINTILMTIIVLLSVSVCFLIFCIAARPRYITATDTAESTVITEDSAIVFDNFQPSSTVPATEPDTPVVEPEPENDVMKGKTSARVNIRNAASTDAKVLETVDEGTTFDILEIQDGWAKIWYHDAEGYISSSYVIITNGNE